MPPLGIKNGQAYDRQIRARVELLYAEKPNKSAIARQLQISRSTVARWLKRCQNNRQVPDALPRGGKTNIEPCDLAPRGQSKYCALTREQKVELAKLQLDRPELTAYELMELGLEKGILRADRPKPSEKSISLMRKQLGFTYKRPVYVDPKVLNDNVVRFERKEWRLMQERQPGEKFLFFDETSFFTNMAPTQVWGVRGKRQPVIVKPKSSLTRTWLQLIIGVDERGQAMLHYRIRPPERRGTAVSDLYEAGDIGFDDAQFPPGPIPLADLDSQRHRATIPRRTLPSLTKEKLKRLAEHYKIKASGTKQDLIDRLTHLTERGYIGIARPGGGSVGGRLFPYEPSKLRNYRFLANAIRDNSWQGRNLVLDNASYHNPPTAHSNSEMMLRFKEDYNVQVMFLPPLSPTLNPAEKPFAKIKHYVRKDMPRTQADLEASIERAIARITPENIRGWLQASKYQLSRVNRPPPVRRRQRAPRSTAVWMDARGQVVERGGRGVENVFVGDVRRPDRRPEYTEPGKSERRSTGVVRGRDHWIDGRPMILVEPPFPQDAAV